MNVFSEWEWVQHERYISQGFLIKARVWLVRNMTRGRDFILLLEFVFLFPWLMLSGSFLRFCCWWAGASSELYYTVFLQGVNTVNLTMTVMRLNQDKEILAVGSLHSSCFCLNVYIKCKYKCDIFVHSEIWIKITLHWF